MPKLTLQFHVVATTKVFTLYILRCRLVLSTQVQVHRHAQNLYCSKTGDYASHPVPSHPLPSCPFPSHFQPDLRHVRHDSKSHSPYTKTIYVDNRLAEHSLNPSNASNHESPPRVCLPASRSLVPLHPSQNNHI